MISHNRIHVTSPFLKTMMTLGVVVFFSLIGFSEAFGYGGGGGGGGGGTVVLPTPLNENAQVVVPYRDSVITRRFDDDTVVTVEIDKYTSNDLISVEVERTPDVGLYGGYSYILKILDVNGDELDQLNKPVRVKLNNVNLADNLNNIRLQSLQSTGWDDISDAVLDPVSDVASFDTLHPLRVAFVNLLDMTTLEDGETLTDANTFGSYDPDAAMATTKTIDTDRGLVPVTDDHAPVCESGSLIKSNESKAVYYCGRDGKRYVFPNESVFRTWFSDFSTLIVLSQKALANIPLGGNITYRPGMRMIKIQTDPRVYAVARGGLLRWIESETVARSLYGSDWNKMIDDVSDAFFVNYRIGDPITDSQMAAL